MRQEGKRGGPAKGGELAASGEPAWGPGAGGGDGRAARATDGRKAAMPGRPGPHSRARAISGNLCAPDRCAGTAGVRVPGSDRPRVGRRGCAWGLAGARFPPRPGPGPGGLRFGGVTNSAAVNTRVLSFRVSVRFRFFGQMHRRGIARSCDNCLTFEEPPNSFARCELSHC